LWLTVCEGGGGGGGGGGDQDGVGVAAVTLFSGQVAC